MSPADSAARRNALYSDRALSGLTEAEEAELAALESHAPDAALAAELERAAAAVFLAGVDPAHERAPMPAALRAKLEADALAFFAQQPGAAVPPGAQPLPLPSPAARRRVDVVRWAGWIAAAACLLLALIAWSRRPRPVPAPQNTIAVPTPPAPPPVPAPPREPTPAEARERLLASAPGSVRVDWSGTRDPAARGVTGDVVWDTTTQRGYMRFRGLAANDPSRQQYQLWIFDETRDRRYPVDGGVFDVPAGTDEVVVPITARLRVNRAAMFAITIERPGGVVVSSRERLVLAAQVGGSQS